MSLSEKESRWGKWIRTLLDPGTRLSVALVGLPGHMRLPQKWESRKTLAHDHLLYLVTDGMMHATIGGETTSLARSDLLWIRPGTSFSCTRANEKPLSILRCRLRLETSRPAPWPWRILPAGNSCLPWLEWLVQEADQPGSWNQLRLHCLIGGFFTELARIDTAAPASNAGLNQIQRQALTDLLAKRADARATPRELARAAGLSYDYFSRCFHRSYGRTPRRWLLEQRIHLAMLRLTETDDRVGEIAWELGYEDLFLFSRQFKIVTGISPLAYRKSHFTPKPAGPEL